MRVLAVLSEYVKRRRTPSDVDAWLHFTGTYGPVVDGRFVTLSELPTSLLVGRMQWASSFGYPRASKTQLRAAGRKHMAAYRKAYRCCVPSRWSGDELIRAGVPASKIRVVGYGPNLALGVPEDRDWSVPVFLFIGWDWSRKNGDAVVRAFVRLRELVPDAVLHLVGDHPPLRVEGVIGHGPLSAFDPTQCEQLAGLFHLSTCLVVPSFVEPFGIVYVEAAQAGLPSIGTSVGGTADSIGDGGILVDPEDQDGLFGAMRSLAEPDTARELGARAAGRAQSLTWAATTDRILEAAGLPAVDLSAPSL
ncbi:MAG: glycosyltransferase family 4 protein [Acidimicrobiia bacterium]|nr:glycosyltransferase family 4 protein [Acidimicrobiia bacterium]